MKYPVQGSNKDGEEGTVCEKEQWKDVGSRSDLSWTAASWKRVSGV